MSLVTRKKIGVLTFHRCINYGSYWQAHCLVNALLKKGHAATQLDHESRRINLAEWRCAYRPVLPTPVPESDFPLYRSKIERFFRAFDTLPSSSRFSIDKPEDMGWYDTVVVGSDEVWNLAHPWYGNSPLFYGEGIQASRVISYAASFGNYPAALGLEEEWCNRLGRFHAISVRDENAREIVRKATGREPALVLDPCLQFELHPEGDFTPPFSKPYAAVYGHNFSASFIRQVRQWAHSKKLALISIGYRNDWADEQWIDAGPDDFAHFMMQASAVATNFFHGCVFALRNSKPFVCETTPYRSQKVRGLMETLDGEHHLVTESTTDADFNARLNEPLTEKIINNINRLRQHSNEWLNRALEVPQLNTA